MAITLNRDHRVRTDRFLPVAERHERMVVLASGPSGAGVLEHPGVPVIAVNGAITGLSWTPASGDRFHIPDRDLDDTVFVVSEMTIETADLPGGRVVKFNGTTEWALDSIAEDEVVWLPHEAQLRNLLGGTFVRLEPVGDGFAVETEGRHGGRYVDVDAERAYARALLARLEA